MAMNIYKRARPSLVHITTLLNRSDSLNLNVQQIPQGTGGKLGVVRDEERTEVEVPSDLGGFAKDVLARLGTQWVVFVLKHYQEPMQKHADVKTEHPVSDFKYEADEGTEKCISYRLKAFDRNDFFDARVYYDPKTLRILKRAFSYDRTKRIEVFEEFTLDADIPDEKFKLPEEKK